MQTRTATPPTHLAHTTGGVGPAARWRQREGPCQAGMRVAAGAVRCLRALLTGRRRQLPRLWQPVAGGRGGRPEWLLLRLQAHGAGSGAAGRPCGGSAVLHCRGALHCTAGTLSAVPGAAPDVCRSPCRAVQEPGSLWDGDAEPQPWYFGSGLDLTGLALPKSLPMGCSGGAATGCDDDDDVPLLTLDLGGEGGRTWPLALLRTCVPNTAHCSHRHASNTRCELKPAPCLPPAAAIDVSI